MSRIWGMGWLYKVETTHEARNGKGRMNFKIFEPQQHTDDRPLTQLLSECYFTFVCSTSKFLLPLQNPTPPCPTVPEPQKHPIQQRKRIAGDLSRTAVPLQPLLRPYHTRLSPCPIGVSAFYKPVRMAAAS